MTLEDCVIKALFNSIARSPTWRVTILSGLVAIDIVVKCILVIKDFMIRGTSKYVTIDSRLMAISTLVVEI